MLYERHYSDDYLIKKYTSTWNGDWFVAYEMYLTMEKYRKRLYKLRKYSDCIDGVFNPWLCQSGIEIGEPEAYEYYSTADSKTKSLLSVYSLLYGAYLRRKIGGANYFKEFYSEVRDFYFNDDPRYLSSYECLFYELDYLEYAYPITISIAKENLKKASPLRWKSFLKNL